MLSILAGFKKFLIGTKRVKMQYLAEGTKVKKSDIETRLDSIEDLPTLPIVLRQLQKFMHNPQSNMRQIADIVAQDQALTSRTIRLVNSAYYGLMSRVSSINQAIVILGLNTLNNLMVGLSVVKMFEKGKKTGFDHEAFWQHAFGTALISRGIAIGINYKEPEDCFIAGLLHDMGRLVMEQHLHHDFIKACAASKDAGTALSLEEQAAFGANHAEAGAFLAKKWRIPEALLAAIQYHHSLSRIPSVLLEHKRLVGIVAKANQLANRFDIGDSGENNVAPDSDFASLKFGSLDVDGIVEMARADVLLTIQEWRK